MNLELSINLFSTLLLSQKNQRSLSNWGKLLTWKIKTVVYAVLHCSALPFKHWGILSLAGNVDFWELTAKWLNCITLPRVTAPPQCSPHPVRLRCVMWFGAQRCGFLASVGHNYRTSLKGHHGSRAPCGIGCCNCITV